VEECTLTALAVVSVLFSSFGVFLIARSPAAERTVKPSGGLSRGLWHGLQRAAATRFRVLR